LTPKALHAYFSGRQVVQIQREGYLEPMTIPSATPEVVDAAIHAAVRLGKLWLTAGPASILAEDIPAGLLTDEALLRPPPSEILASSIVPATQPEAWAGESASAAAIA